MNNGSSDEPNKPSNNYRGAPDGADAGEVPPQILVVDMDRALLGLLEEWLGESGMQVVADPDRESERDQTVSLVIVDIPNPRHAGIERLRRIAQDHPTAPVIALSSTFFPGIDCKGGVAHALGVACVLPKPVSRESLIRAVQSLLDR